MNSSNETIEYLYEKIIKLMMPVYQMPASFPAYISPVLSNNLHQGNYSVMPFNRSEFEHVIKLLIGYDHCNNIVSQSRYNTNLCYKAFRLDDILYNAGILHELLELLEHVDNNFTAYLSISCIVTNSYRAMGSSLVRQNIEFSVCLAGFDPIDLNSKSLTGDALRDEIALWDRICIDHDFLHNFSVLVGEYNKSCIVFSADYLKTTYVVNMGNVVN